MICPLYHAEPVPTCLLFKDFLVAFCSTSVPSIPLRTLIKSLFETEDISLARFLSELPASFIFSSTFLWCFRTALNNWTTPLGDERKCTVSMHPWIVIKNKPKLFYTKASQPWLTILEGAQLQPQWTLHSKSCSHSPTAYAPIPLWAQTGFVLGPAQIPYVPPQATRSPGRQSVVLAKARI